MADAPENLLHTPLYGLHTDLGARMVPFAGYAMPVQFSAGIMAEHKWTRENAGLFDVSHMGQVFLTGDNADAALETLVPGDILGLKPGRMRYSLLLNEKGGTLDDLMITRRENDLYVVVNGACKEGDIAHMRAHLEPKGVTVTYRDDLALLALQGPKAADALSRLLPGVVNLTFMTAGAFDWDGTPLWVSRSGYTGEDGFEISLPAEKARAFARTLLTQPDVEAIGLGARDSLRLEAGLPLYGHDLDTDITPVEAGLSFAISKRRKAEGGFLGAEVVLDQILNGTARKRVGLKLDGRQPAREGAIVESADGQEIGFVTSGGFAPTVQAPIAMAFVAKDFAADGTQVTIDVRGRKLTATVVPMPFVPHRYVRSNQPA
ncbi:glycine cleavage system aminomethyltransferase GcvT [Pedomonas mirosovicensis]|uniref:glycine cleavage system aminomethyltransferase GcvT n=1 Tax=Pedomonas mirosovicensis TaxID=2908641 RepID=UPI002168B399|nr:glycine cleavage system aminomethyltransferase GcvT [Pedomonas mirosovicensis]MCH8685425.1 glycine cleavage system aminomethyltransferase GcvT [Pedomonas mirosovicensis]